MFAYSAACTLTLSASNLDDRQLLFKFSQWKSWLCCSSLFWSEWQMSSQSTAWTATAITIRDVSILSTIRHRWPTSIATPKGIRWTLTWGRRFAERLRNEVSVCWQLPADAMFWRRLQCFLVNQKVRVIRSCGYILGAAKVNQCTRQSLSQGNDVRYCQCDTDFCNSSQVPAYSLFALVVSVLLNKFI